MFLWFLGTAIVAVWFVFRDERFDYRWLCLGALLPDLVDAPMGGARAVHSVVTSIVALCVVMLATINRRDVRRRLLALPIGMFLHLVFDGAFANTRVFWWPLSGFSFRGSSLPSVDRGIVNVFLEMVGAALLWWVWRRFRLNDPSRRSEFLRTGRLRDNHVGNAGTC